MDQRGGAARWSSEVERQGGAVRWRVEVREFIWTCKLRVYEGRDGGGGGRDGEEWRQRLNDAVRMWIAARVRYGYQSEQQLPAAAKG